MWHCRLSVCLKDKQKATDILSFQTLYAVARCRHRNQASFCYVTTETISSEDRVQLAFEKLSWQQKKSVCYLQQKAFREGGGECEGEGESV